MVDYNEKIIKKLIDQGNYKDVNKLLNVKINGTKQDDSYININKLHEIKPKIYNIFQKVKYTEIKLNQSSINLFISNPFKIDPITNPLSKSYIAEINNDKSYLSKSTISMNKDNNSNNSYSSKQSNGDKDSLDFEENILNLPEYSNINLKEYKEDDEDKKLIIEFEQKCNVEFQNNEKSIIQNGNNIINQELKILNEQNNMEIEDIMSYNLQIRTRKELFPFLKANINIPIIKLPNLNKFIAFCENSESSISRSFTNKQIKLNIINKKVTENFNDSINKPIKSNIIDNLNNQKKSESLKNTYFSLFDKDSIETITNQASFSKKLIDKFNTIDISKIKRKIIKKTITITETKSTNTNYNINLNSFNKEYFESSNKLNYDFDLDNNITKNIYKKYLLNCRDKNHLNLKEIITQEIQMDQLTNTSNIDKLELSFIQKIELSTEKLSSIKNLFLFKNLKECNFANNNISSINLQDIIQNAQNIKYQFDDKTQLSKYYSELRNNSLVNSLIILNLSTNNLAQISSLKQFNCLSNLNISYNSLKEIPILPSSIIILNLQNNLIETIKNIPFQTEELNLIGNHIKKVTNLKNNYQLKILNLGRNLINNIDNIAEELMFIEELYLYNNSISYFPDKLFLPFLKHIHLQNNYICGIFSLITLPNLQTINIQNNNISFILKNSFSKLVNLRNIDLSFNKIDNIDLLIESFGNHTYFNYLECVNIENNPFNQNNELIVMSLLKEININKHLSKKHMLKYKKQLEFSPYNDEYDNILENIHNFNIMTSTLSQLRFKLISNPSLFYEILSLNNNEFQSIINTIKSEYQYNKYQCMKHGKIDNNNLITVYSKLINIEFSLDYKYLKNIAKIIKIQKNYRGHSYRNTLKNNIDLKYMQYFKYTNKIMYIQYKIRSFIINKIKRQKDEREKLEFEVENLLLESEEFFSLNIDKEFEIINNYKPNLYTSIIVENLNENEVSEEEKELDNQDNIKHNNININIDNISEIKSIKACSRNPSIDKSRNFSGIKSADNNNSFNSTKKIITDLKPKPSQIPVNSMLVSLPPRSSKKKLPKLNQIELKYFSDKTLPIVNKNISAQNTLNLKDTGRRQSIEKSLNINTSIYTTDSKINQTDTSNILSKTKISHATKYKLVNNSMRLPPISKKLDDNQIKLKEKIKEIDNQCKEAIMKAKEEWKGLVMNDQLEKIYSDKIRKKYEKEKGKLLKNN